MEAGRMDGAEKISPSLKVECCIRFFLFLSVAIALFPTSTFAQVNKASDTSALFDQLSEKLNSLSTVSYHYRRELNYASENYDNIVEADLYLEFNNEQTPGFLYQAHLSDGFEFFNGSEVVHGTASTHVLQMAAVHGIDGLKNNSFLFNSFLTLRRALPALLADTTVKKSVAPCDSATCVLNLTIPHATLSAIGTLSPIQLQRDITYSITINRNTMLPTKVRQTNSANGDFMEVQFLNVNLHPEKPSAASWLYTSYSTYKFAPPANAPKLLAVGSIAPAWTVPSLEDATSEIDLPHLLQQSDAKLVLLEFWISHCGYSIAAVHTLNAISQRYKESLKIVAVNPDDDALTMKLFQKNFSPGYPLFLDKSGVAQQYGVSFYPTVFLINREGRIVYAGAADEASLLTAINKSL